MSDAVTREECQISMTRLHERVDQISNSAVRIEESSKRMEKWAEDMHKIIYGNGNNSGLSTKITQLFERLGLHTKIIMGTILAVIAGVVKMIFNGK